MRYLVVGFLCACASAPSRPAVASDPLAELNQAARADYAEARQGAVANGGPVLIVGPDRIKLLQGSARSEFELQSARYHDLKAIAHLALGSYALQFQAVPDPTRVAELRALADKALEAVALNLTPDQVERQREIVRLTVAVPRPAGWERAIAPLLLANAMDAARAEIGDLEAAMSS